MASSKVLVVDDEPAITGLLELALERAGYRVRIANSGHEALRAALADPPDVVLMDICMPDMSGEQVLREMLRHPELSRVPVVLATGEIDPEPAVRGFSLLFKPFDLRQLYATVKAALSVAPAAPSV